MTRSKGIFNLPMDRRRCVKTVLLLGAGILSGVGFTNSSEAQMEAVKSKVVIAKTQDRLGGITGAMSHFDLTAFHGASVALKANYNSADSFPASTHPDTLRALAQGLKYSGVRDITLIERSGMGNTAGVLERMGANAVAEELDIKVVVMDDLGVEDYVLYEPQNSHWKRGFLLARPFVEADRVVQTCCLKTHRYGGHFTFSLKNAVGAIAKYDPKDNYNYMTELHRSPKQRSLIAEISQAYRNHLIVMDALKGFVDGGPDTGKEVAPGVIVVGTDPVAIDAVGVALLRMYGTTPNVSEGPIFEQEQIKRAAELGLGVTSANDIELVPMGEGAEAFVEGVRNQLDS